MRGTSYAFPPLLPQYCSVAAPVVQTSMGTAEMLSEAYLSSHKGRKRGSLEPDSLQKLQERREAERGHLILWKNPHSPGLPPELCAYGNEVILEPLLTNRKTELWSEPNGASLQPVVEQTTGKYQHYPEDFSRTQKTVSKYNIQDVQDTIHNYLPYKEPGKCDQFLGEKTTNRCQP